MHALARVAEVRIVWKTKTPGLIQVKTRTPAPAAEGRLIQVKMPGGPKAITCLNRRSDG